ncbi:MAG TPA: RNA-binding S4 domain-containing protein [Patescibacteria group bacterium]|nr:RNA-binding S4 domain-containing protein [Patescibacteria group bacterium]
MPPALRLDKWLWFARLCKTRSLAQALIDSGAVRVNGAPAFKSSTILRPGDEVLVPQGRSWRRVRVVDSGKRRGPASEAQRLYDELSPPAISPDGELTFP